MQGVILAGGLGLRLRPLTKRVPKVMLEIRGKPLLYYPINHLKRNEVDELVILSGYKHQIIEEFFGDGSKFGVRIDYSVEKESLGTGGAVYNARNKINDDFILLNGDIITNFPLSEMIEVFKKNNENVMALVRPKNPYGVVDFEFLERRVSRIKRFVEKPRMNEWINAGYSILKYETLDRFPERGSVEEILYPQLAKEGKLLGYHIDERYFWKSIDTIKDFEEVVNMRTGFPI